MGECWSVADVVDGDDLEVRFHRMRRAVDVAANTSEAIDTDLEGHKGGAPIRRGGPARLSEDGPDVMLCGAACRLRCACLYEGIRQLLEPAQTVIDSRL